tara:strand:- start:1681 stop:1914 length:234 start_codon:yes stop_codon:yes gene_type:complete
MFSDVDKEVILMNLESGTYFNLNSVGSAIWHFLETDITVKDIISKLVNEFKISEKECELSVMKYLSSLKDANVIQTS